ncbi:pmt3 [Symbiodinium necroappetens]|uniref:Pmt3 protein n=1 Tax=Symbiodinium necroappetens TaxID=1628268 RepID=A0A813A2S2_9DINO|nr:pmt3 [Symbiodinium necroappetens]
MASIPTIFATEWADARLAIRLTMLNTSWQRVMVEWLEVQTSVDLRNACDAELTSVSRLCPKLESLDISDSEALTSSAVVDALRRCPNLKTLIAWGSNPAQTLRGWRAIQEAKPDLAVVGRQARLVIRVRAPNLGWDREVRFDVREGLPLGKLMETWCSRFGISSSQVRFLSDGERISPSDTCASLGLKDGDELDAVLEQMNIGQWQALDVPEASMTQLDRLLHGKLEPHQVAKETVLSIARSVLAPAASPRLQTMNSVQGEVALPWKSCKVLDRDQCKKLVEWTESSFERGQDVHDFQLRLTAAQLDQLTCDNTSRTLTACAESVLNGQEVAPPYFILRRHAASDRQRLRIPFHRDYSLAVVNVSLNSEYTGGKLMFVDGARLICPERKPGCATAHNQTAIHGVSSITAGVRYNLLAAFDSAE